MKYGTCGQRLGRPPVDVWRSGGAYPEQEGVRLPGAAAQGNAKQHIDSGLAVRWSVHGGRSGLPGGDTSRRGQGGSYLYINAEEVGSTNFSFFLSFPFLSFTSLVNAVIGHRLRCSTQI